MKKGFVLVAVCFFASVSVAYGAKLTGWPAKLADEWRDRSFSNADVIPFVPGEVTRTHPYRPPFDVTLTEIVPHSMMMVEEPRSFEFEAKKGADGAYEVALSKDVAPGYYDLVLYASDRRKRRRAYRVLTTRISVHDPSAPGSLTVLPMNGREVFVEGEEIDLGVVIGTRNDIAKGVLELSLIYDPADQQRPRFPTFTGGGAPALATYVPPSQESSSLTVLRRSLEGIRKGRHTVHARIGHEVTSALRAGRYRLQAKLGALVSRQFPFELISTTRRTHYPLVDNSHSPFRYADARSYYTTARGVPALSLGRIYIYQMLGKMGFNARNNDYYWHPKTRDAIRDLLSVGSSEALDPSMPAVEPLVPPDNAQLRMQEQLRNGCAFMPAVFPGCRHIREIGIPRYLDANDRLIQLTTQAFRRHPNMAGLWPTHFVMLSFMAGKGAGHDPGRTPEDVALSRYYIWKDFAEKHGVTDNTNADLLMNVFGVGSIPDEGTVSLETPELYRNWIIYLRSLISKNQLRWQAAQREICPDTLSTVNRCTITSQVTALLPWSPVRRAGCCRNQSPWYSLGGVDVILSSQSNDDWGNHPYTSTLLCDIFQNQMDDGKPVWRCGWGCWTASKTEFFRDALQAVARGGVAGFLGYPTTFWWLTHNYNRSWHHGRVGAREHSQLVTDVLRAYGPAFMNLKKEKKVAVFASLTEGASDKKQRHTHSLWPLFVACHFAHHPATVIGELDIEKGSLKDYKVVVASHLHFALPKHIEKLLTEWTADGGVLLVDKDTEISIPGMRRMDLQFNEWADYLLSRKFMKDHHTDWPDYTWRKIREFARMKVSALKEILDEVDPLDFDCPDPDVLLSTQQGGDATYYFAVNHTPAPYFNSAAAPRSRPFVYQGEAYPTRTALRVPGSGALYDLLNGRCLRPKRRRGEWQFEGDFSSVEGRIYVSLPSPIGSAHVEVSSRVAAGSLLKYRAEIRGENGKALDAVLPLQILVKDPSGKLEYELFRATSGRALEGQLKMAANHPAGQWTVEVRELLSGCRAKASFDVVESKVMTAASEKSRLLPDVVLSDGDAIRKLLEKKPVLYIPLETMQASIKKELDRLVTKLKGLGVRCVYQDVEDAILGQNIALWRKYIEYPEPQVYGNLLLIGTPRTNRLVNKLDGCDMLMRHLSPDYPGRGGALIGYAWSPFWGSCDVIYLMANDEEGVKKAMASFWERVVDGKGEVVGERLETVRNALLPYDYRRYREKQIGHALPDPVELKVSPSKMTRGSPERDRATPLFDGRLGVQVSAIAFSPDGRRIVVGTDGARNENLVVLARSGKVLRRIGTGEDWVQELEMPDDAHILVGLSGDGSIRAYSVKGKLKWSSKAHVAPGVGETPHNHPEYFSLGYNEPPYFATAPEKGVVITNEAPGKLACRNVADGKILWSYNYQPEGGPIDYYVMGLAVTPDGGRVAASLMMTLNDPKKLTPEQAGEHCKDVVICLSGEDGKPLWQKEFPYGAKVLKSLHGRWSRFPLIGPLTMSQDGSRIFVQRPTYGTGYTFDAEGNEVARFHPQVSHSGELISSRDGSTLLILPNSPCPSRTIQYDVPVVHILNTKEGTQATVVGDEGARDGLLMSDGSRAIVARWGGKIRMLDRNGNVQWEKDVRMGSCLALSADEKLLAAGTAGGRVFILDLSGRTVSSIDL